MTGTSFYYAWYPVLEHRNKRMSIILTSGMRTVPPAGGERFFQNLLDLSGITAELIAWRANPFISSYFSKGAWEEAWDVKIIVASPVKQPSDSTLAGVGVFVEPEGEEDGGRYVPVRVFADFDRRRDAEQCRGELREHASKAEWNDVHYEGYDIRDVGPRHKQLVTTVASAERSRIQPVIDAAETVIEICERHGGRTQAL